MIKNEPGNAGDAGNIGSGPEWGRSPLEEEMATHSSILAWKIPWTEKPGRLQSMGSLYDPMDGLYLPLSATYLAHVHKYVFQKMTKNPGIFCHNPVALLLNLGSGNIMKPLDPSDYTTFFRG